MWNCGDRCTVIVYRAYVGDAGAEERCLPGALSGGGTGRVMLCVRQEKGSTADDQLPIIAMYPVTPDVMMVYVLGKAGRLSMPALLVKIAN